MNLPFYKQFTEDIYSRTNKFQQDVLFEALNNFHPNTKWTIEVNLGKFLDTKIILNNSSNKTGISKRKEKKLCLMFLKFRKDISETPFT